MTTRRAVARITLFALLSRIAVPAAPPANSWNKIRYQGGTVSAKVNPFDWHTTVTIHAAQVEVVCAGRTKIEIPISEITSVSYGQHAYRRVADMAISSLLATPIALFGLLHKSKDHLVAIRFRTPDKQNGGILIAVHKASYRDLLEAARAATRKPVENWP